MAQRMAEQEEKERLRKAELKRQESLLREEGLKKEKDEQRKREDAKRMEEQRLVDAKRLQDSKKRQDDDQKKRETGKANEKAREEEMRYHEELRKQELQRLEQLRMKALQQQQKASAKVELKYYSTTDSRPGDMHGFGFGNVTTGQVSSRKYEILAKASSVGAEDREGLNPDLIRVSMSARASPAPGMAQQQIMAVREEVDSQQQAMMKSTSGFQQSADFEQSTAALSTGLTRKQQSSMVSQQQMSSEMKSMSMSSQQMSMSSSSQFASSSSASFSSSSVQQSQTQKSVTMSQKK